MTYKRPKGPAAFALAGARFSVAAAILLVLAGNAGCLTAASTALAKDSSDAAVQAREQQWQAERQQREMQKRAAEQQREMQKRAREQQREERKRAQNQQHQQTQTQTQANGHTAPSGKAPQPQASGSAGSGQNSKTNKADDERSVDANAKPNAVSKDVDRKSDPAPKEADDPPPATIQEWLKHIASPSGTNEKKAQHEQATVPDTIKPAEPAAVITPGTTQTSGPPPTTPQKAKTPQRGGTPPPIEIPQFEPQEVLAVNATTQVIAQAKALGFKVNSATTLKSLALSVARLTAPDGMNSAEAEAFLQQKLPNVVFALNKKYRIYRTATGTEPQQENRTAPPAKSLREGGCSGDHCFGRDVVGWRPELSTCSKGVSIGIIDTAIDTSHPVFKSKKLEVNHFGSGGGRGPDWHGTGVTALLAGDSASAIPGLVPDATFLIADVFHADTDNQPASDTLSMLRAFDWLEQRGAKIVNMSLAGPPDDLLRTAIERLAEKKGIIFVAAAGNEGPAAGPSYPAAYDHVIAVTAVGKDLASYRYANRGDYIDFAAPGVAIWTALPGAGEGYHSGTSFATPYVTAAIASYYNRLPSKSKAEAIRAIKVRDLGAPGPDPIYGRGLILAPEPCNAGLAAAAPSQPIRPAAGYSASAAPERGEVLPWLGLAPEQ